MNKTILITGSSTGIGKAVARHFHAHGWNVVATMRSPENENELNVLDNVLVTRLDVLDLESIDQAVNAGIEKFGKIDVLLNNAGYGAYGPLEAFPKENIVRQFNTNVIGLLDTTRAVLPHFRKNKNGTIINVSSIGGQMTFPLGSLYHGTKFAVEGISEALAFELNDIGINVKIIEPGIIDTDFSGRSFDFQNDPKLEEYQGVVSQVMQAFGGMGSQSSKPELVAEIIFEAANDKSNKMRYRAGEDAQQLLTARKSTDEDEFIQNIKNQFQL
ncbi:SDR family oxidoreductase [Aureibacter tunicatorum]|uniref:NAD(P)-dependent dehydrogenase (Short-subunit alcohol dehydrogenase family) n=1 Tax=Aureibacter tunicatorum TaxID=866807 RepID=A0AAE3XQ06_9BACT|nr:SDR family oxidoreductase [Aureibacter tunicatorum]MDR6240500.1 NAD(P)-dependent dehydrogenase (short-subunit alcohol dehydrogenase family) [Aureibacter tunicatorum]BDD06637.1 short-chain dehydrogenase/reductase [Aureibacter tunicatorum]